MSIQFQVTETRSADSSAPAAVSPGEHSQTVPCTRAVPRVLVVEGDQALRDLICDVFAFEGYFVTEGIDECGLLREVRSNGLGNEPFDLVVLGLQTQGALDVDTLVRLRRAGCHTPAIVLAARDQASIAERLNELDALFLGKPFALENLRVLANHVIHARQCGLETQLAAVD